MPWAIFISTAKKVFDPTFAGGSALPQARLSLQQQVANTITFTYTQDLSQSIPICRPLDLDKIRFLPYRGINGA